MEGAGEGQRRQGGQGQGAEVEEVYGRYYQSISAAIAAVYELALREDDGASVDLGQALERADGIKRELLDATADLKGAAR